MIRVKELPKFKDMHEAFEYRLKLNAEKKYQLPYFTHAFRGDTLLIDNEKVDVLLSNWSLKQSIKNVDGFPYRFSILETGDEKYVLHVMQCKHPNRSEFIEGLTELPSMDEIVSMTKQIDWRR